MTIRDHATDADAEMLRLVGGEYLQGSDDHYPEEGPTRRVRVGPFEIATTPVTNAAFATFVQATGYVTVAERPLDPADYPGAPAANLRAGSLVFVPSAGPVDLRHMSQWWRWTPGACWHHPEGPGSDLHQRMDHPVVHVAYEDASEYAAWARFRLPTEAEWEFAARGGLEGAEFTWGSDELAGGRRNAKYFEGSFPWRNDATDGWERTAPVGSFPPNGYGLFDLAGNVWEWTQDWYADRGDAPERGSGESCCVPCDPRGPTRDASFDPAQPQFPIPRRVIKGGSFLCADEYCRRYRPSARRPQMIDTGMSHIGFRCAADASTPV